MNQALDFADAEQGHIVIQNRLAASVVAAPPKASTVKLGIRTAMEVVHTVSASAFLA